MQLFFSTCILFGFLECSTEETNEIIRFLKEGLIDDYPLVNLDNNLPETTAITNQAMSTSNKIHEKSRKRIFTEVRQEYNPNFEPDKRLKAGGEEVIENPFSLNKAYMLYNDETINYLCDDQETNSSEIEIVDLDTFNQNRKQRLPSLLTGSESCQVSDDPFNDKQSLKEELGSNPDKLEAHFTDDEIKELDDILTDKDTTNFCESGYLSNVSMKVDEDFENCNFFHKLLDNLLDIEEQGVNPNTEMCNSHQNLERGENSNSIRTQDVISQSESTEERFLKHKYFKAYRSKELESKFIKHCHKKLAANRPQAIEEISFQNIRYNVDETCFFRISDFFILTGRNKYKHLEDIRSLLLLQKPDYSYKIKKLETFLLIIRNVLWESDMHKMNFVESSQKKDLPLKYDEKIPIGSQVKLVTSSLIFSELTQKDIGCVKPLYSCRFKSRYFLEIEGFNELLLKKELYSSRNTDFGEQEDMSFIERNMRIIETKIERCGVNHLFFKKAFDICLSIFSEKYIFEKSEVMTTMSILSFQQDYGALKLMGSFGANLNHNFNSMFFEMANKKLFSFFNVNFVKKAYYFPELFSLQEIFLRKPEALEFQKIRSCDLLFLLLRFDSFFSVLSKITHSEKSFLKTKLYIREFIMKEIYLILNLPQRVIIIYLWFSRLEFFFLINNTSLEITGFTPLIMLFYSFFDLVFCADRYLIQRTHCFFFGLGLDHKVIAKMAFKVFQKRATFLKGNSFDFLKRLYGFLIRNNQIVYGIVKCNKLLEDIKALPLGSIESAELIEGFYKTIIDSLKRNMSASDV